MRREGEKNGLFAKIILISIRDEYSSWLLWKRNIYRIECGSIFNRQIFLFSNKNIF